MNNLKFENKNTIVNFSNSILKHYNAPTHHESIPEVDKVLEGHKKVVVMLFDALGTAIRQYHLDKNSNLQKNFIHKMVATYPPTTVASTNACLSGKFPIETGWYGWRQYYEDLGCNILVFKSVDPDTDTYYESSCGNIHREKFGYETIIEQIKKANKNLNVGSVFPRPIDPKGPKHLLGYSRRINKFLKNKDECLMYVYDTQPDADLHEYGVHSKKAHKQIVAIDKFVGKMAKKHQDTLFLVIADHGMVDVKTLWVFEHEDLVDTFKNQPSLEGRTPTFFIKDKEHDNFVKLFNRYYGDKFILMTRKEALDSHMFGEGNINKESLRFIGDYVAVSNTEYCFDMQKNRNPKFKFFAHHAGYTKEEMEIDISALNA